MKWLFLLCTTFLAATIHDVPMARYTIFKESQTLFVTVEFDEEDVYEQLQTNDHLFKVEQLVAHFQQNFKLYFDWCAAKAEVIEFQKTSHHFQLKVKIASFPAYYERIQIENTCLLRIDNHSNVVKFMLKERQRDFLMNKDRTQIDVTVRFE